MQCKDLFLLLLIVTELQGRDAAPGCHEVLLAGELEVGCAGGVVRHHHVDIPGQHRTPQQLLNIMLLAFSFIDYILALG